MADGADGERYRAFVERCNRVTLENDLKWVPWDEANASEEQMDTLRSAGQWLEERGIPIRGHYIHWAVIEGGSLPPHVAEEYNGNVQELLDAWATNMRGRVPAATEIGDVVEWDDINHPVVGVAVSPERKLSSALITMLTCSTSRRSSPAAEHWINEGSMLSGYLELKRTNA